jgi:hypothetical protein
MVIILVDEVPFSKEAFCWFSQKKHLANAFLSGTHEIPRFFRPYMKVNDPDKDEYQDLNAGEMWALFYNIFLLMSDINKDTPPLSRLVTTTELKTQLLVVEKVMVYWSFATGLDESVLVGLEREFVGADKDATNMRFCFYVYCMMNAIWDRYERLVNILYGREVPELNSERIDPTNGDRITTKYTNNEYADDVEAGDSFMRDVVRHCCAGDFDDFIISVKETIYDKSLGPYHIELAKYSGYEKMGMSNFKEEITKSEVWRRLFTSYFDMEEVNFNLFYQTFTYHCLYFLMMSFLSLNDCGGISYIPIYKLYSDNAFRETYEMTVKPMIDTKLIKACIYKLYKIRVK